MRRADLARILGGRSRVSEFFTGKRQLSISQIRRLRQILGIPADLLLEQEEKPYEAGGARRIVGEPVKVLYHTDDPTEPGRMPGYYQPPEDPSRERPVALYVRKGILLDILDMNIASGLRNKRADGPQWNAEIEAAVARFRVFRDWVAASPNPHVYTGLYPTAGYDIVRDSEGAE